MDVLSNEARNLVLLIGETFRVHQNQDPVYVDVGDALARLQIAQHQIIFGRRGSGKSCLLVHYQKSIKDSNISINYINCDANKRGQFPDLLTSLLISIFKSLPGGERPWWKRVFPKAPAERVVESLAGLLHSASESQVETTSAEALKSGIKSNGASGFPVSGSVAAESSSSIREQFKRYKLEKLQRSLDEYRAAIDSSVPPGKKRRVSILLDDFYLIEKNVQPDVIDYIHRLLRGTNVYFKVGTIRHRTSLRRHDGQTIGVELGQDVQAINLDRTLAEFDDTKNYLEQMINALGAKCGIQEASSSLMNSDAMQALTIASGGVPRDCLTIISKAIELARKEAKPKVTPTHVWRAAAGTMLHEKRANLSEDAGVDAGTLEAAFADLIKYCLVEKKKTAFLVDHADSLENPGENEILQQLMDFKLIHQIESDTSASSGRGGRRFSAYILDASIFMHPRKRRIEVIEFWRKDDQRNPVGVRQAPVYELARIKAMRVTDGIPSVNLDAALMGVSHEEDAVGERMPGPE